MAALLIVAGDHVPVILFVEVVGRDGTDAPEQIGPIVLKVGVKGGVTVIGTVAVAVHPHALVTVRVYEVDVVGQAVGVKTLVADKPVAGNQA